MKSFNNLMALLIAAFAFGCSAPPEPESTGVAEQFLCSKNVQLNVSQAYERTDGTCGAYQTPYNQPASSPFYYRLASQVGFQGGAASCQYVSPGICNMYATGTVFAFNATLACTGFPSGSFNVDLKKSVTSGWTARKYGGSCDSTYDLTVNETRY